MASLVSRWASLQSSQKEADAKEGAGQSVVLPTALCCGALLVLGSPQISSPRLLDATLLSSFLVALTDWQVQSAGELVVSVQRYNIALAFLAILLPRCKALLVAAALSTLASSLRAFRLPQGLDASHAEQLLWHLVLARVGIGMLVVWSRCQLLRESATSVALETLLDSASKGFCVVDRRGGAVLTSSATLRAKLGDVGLVGRSIEEWAPAVADVEALRAMLRCDADSSPTVVAQPSSVAKTKAGSMQLVPCPLSGRELLVAVEFLEPAHSAAPAARAREEAGTQTEQESRAGFMPRTPGPGSAAASHTSSTRSRPKRNISPSMRSRSEHSSRSGGALDIDMDAGQSASGHRTNQTVTSVEAAVAQFKTTQPQVCANSVLWLMSHWNTPRDSLRANCCPYHAQLAIASKIVSVLETRPCNPLWSPFLSWQCKTCSCMNSHDGFECTICGSGGNGPRSGPPSAASKYYGSDVESIAEMPDDEMWVESDAWQSRDEAGGAPEPRDGPS